MRLHALNCCISFDIFAPAAQLCLVEVAVPGTQRRLQLTLTMLKLAQRSAASFSVSDKLLAIICVPNSLTSFCVKTHRFPPRLCASRVLI